MQPSSEWGPANTVDRERHQRYNGVLLPMLCMDPNLLAQLMSSNMSNISEAEIGRRLGGLTPAQSEAVLQVIAQSHAGTPNLTPAASLLAIARSNGSFSQLSTAGNRKRNTASECSEV